MNDKTNQLHESTFATVQRIEPVSTIGEMDLGSVGPYRLLRELGRGGMGAVYLAKHTNLQRMLAIKVLPSEYANSPDRLERFRREMAAIGRLEHPNIVLATDAGEKDGTAYIAMQYLDGCDMSAVLKRERTLAIADVSEIVRQAAVGLQHVFESGLVHRDIKPSNLFLTRHGEIKILDLGLAMLRDNDGLSSAITAPNAIMGTPDFIAPEQINSCHEVDIRADVYSLGCTYYTLLAGKAPFEGQQFSTTTSKLVAHAEKKAVSLKSIRPDVPDAIVQIVDRMMAKSPNDRFANPKMVADALTEWSKGSNLSLLANPSASSKTVSYARTTNHIERRRTRLVAWAFGFCAGAVLLGLLYWMWPKTMDLVSSVQNKTDDATTSDSSNANRPPTEDAPTGSKSSAASDSTSSLQSPPIAASIDSSLQQISKSAQAIESSNQRVEENTRKIAQSFEELLKQLSSAQSTGPLKDPRTPGEHYYNAIVYGMQGNPRMARQSFLAYFDSNQDYIDPHLKFIETLTLQEGKSAVRELYKDLAGDKSFLSRQFAEATLLDPEARKQALQAMVAEHEDFAPAWFALSSLYSAGSASQQTLNEVSQELNYLKRFMAAHDRGGLLKYYLDPSEAASLVNRADTRRKALGQIDPDRLRSPVTWNVVMKLGDNWQASIEIAEPAKEIFYRMGENGDFQSLGKSIGTDPATGLPLLKKSFTIPGTTTNTSVFFEYMDMKDHVCGPFRLSFDAQEQTVKWERYMIQQMKPNWVRLLDDRLFFDVFQTGRSVLQEVRYGVDVETPNKIKVIPQAPISAENSKDYLEVVPATSKFAVVQIVFSDGSKSEVVRVEKR